MKILVVGSGGREHALTWKISQSKKVDKIYCAPGNAGTKALAENINIKQDDISALLSFAKKEKIGLTCVGPEAPLVLGITDLFSENKLRIFGPTKKAAILEGSKIFAKEAMRKFGVPTADFEIFDSPDKAKSYIKAKKGPLVIKADGLAAGKGVIVAKNEEEAIGAVNKVMIEKSVGSAGNKIIIEDCLEGEEASILVLTDGENIVPLASSQDHKRIFDGDKGPNTGGMGAYSPAPLVTDLLFDEIIDTVINPVIKGMKKEKTPYKGVLYAGIMVTKDGPKVLEFNARFGDPETQAILPRMKSDLVEFMEHSIDGNLKGKKIDWDKRSCVSVVLASKGYPGDYEKGKIISGLEFFKGKKDIFAFHAGTKIENGNVVASGGRVLNISGLGETINEAIEKTYGAVAKVSFDGMQYRRDIAKKALKSLR